MQFTGKVALVLWVVYSLLMWLWGKPLDGQTQFTGEPQSVFAAIFGWALFSLIACGPAAFYSAKWISDKFRDESDKEVKRWGE